MAQYRHNRRAQSDTPRTRGRRLGAIAPSLTIVLVGLACAAPTQAAFNSGSTR